MWKILRMAVVLHEIQAVIHMGKCPNVTYSHNFNFMPRNTSYLPLFAIEKDLPTTENFYPRFNEDILYKFYWKNDLLIKSLELDCSWEAAMQYNHLNGSLGEILWVNNFNSSLRKCQNNEWKNTFLWNTSYPSMFIIWGCRENKNTNVSVHMHALWVLLETDEYNRALFTPERIMFYREKIYELLAPTNISNNAIALISSDTNGQKGNKNSVLYCPSNPCEASRGEYFNRIICGGILLIFLINCVLVTIYREIKGGT